MLSETSYLTAIYVYIGSAAALLLLLLWWFRRRPALAALLVLLSAALLLTPAYPRDGVSTLAPALVVAGFQLLTEGYETAMHALRPLGFMSGLAIALALLLRISVVRKRKPKPQPPQPEGENVGTPAEPA